MVVLDTVDYCHQFLFLMYYTDFPFAVNLGFYRHTYVERFRYIVFKFYVNRMFIHVCILHILISRIIFPKLSSATESISFSSYSYDSSTSVTGMSGILQFGR